MPAIKRFFPVSHDINRDPEFMELSRRFGATGIRAWLEILSIADRNGGALPGPWDAYPRILAGACESSARRMREVCEWVARWLRVDHEGTTRVANAGKYHKSWNHYPLPPNLTGPNLTPSLKKEKDKPASPEPSAYSLKPKAKTLDPAIKAAADRVYQSDPNKFGRLIVWIKQAQAGRWPDRSIAAALERFYPYRASVGENWWPYLDTLIAKADKDLNAADRASEHEAFKTEVRETAKLLNLVKGGNA